MNRRSDDATANLLPRRRFPFEESNTLGTERW